MTCAWNELLRILPPWMRESVDTQGRQNLQELRLRLGQEPELVFSGKYSTVSRKISVEDLNYCINTASRYSPWASQSVSRGYLTGPGGHRIGLCGEGICQSGNVSGIRSVRGLCIRVARDIPGVAGQAPSRGSLLILGAPGWGKTTLLRDLIRRRSERSSVAVVDERGELFPDGFDRGFRTDVMTGVRKAEGIEMLLRTMGPSCIAMDEITAPEDADALMQAAGCGVELLATVHAGSIRDFFRNSTYQALKESGIFEVCLVLNRRQTYTVERMEAICCG